MTVSLPPARALSDKDRGLEDAVRASIAQLAEPRALNDAKGNPLPRWAASDLAGRYASQCSGGRARLKAYLTMAHPWSEHVRDLHDRLAAEEQRFWAIAREKTNV